MQLIETDICVIGGGSGGLSVAAGAAQMGARVVLLEQEKMGGDCLNTGCVPSKALLAAAHAAANIRNSNRFGVTAGEPVVDFKRVHEHVQSVIAAIAPHDSVERFQSLGVQVIQEHGEFLDGHTVATATCKIRARRFVIATGSRAAQPPIPGLSETPHLTNETIFELTTAPSHLVILGAGPIGLEMAQAFGRLGCKVTVLEAFHLLGRDDPELTDRIRQRLTEEGVVLLESTKVNRVERHRDGISVYHGQGNTEEIVRLDGSHLLVATGREPNTAGLGLDAAGVQYTRQGIAVDQRLRTSNKRIFAIGDAIGGLQFTHVAGYHAGIVIRNILFHLPAKVDLRAIPRVTYTDPELAQVGLTAAEAEKAGHTIRVLQANFSDNDRARAGREIDGAIKVVCTDKGVVLGAGIVGAGAGELILPWVWAVAERRKIGTLAGLVVPYPTMSEISKRAAGSYFTPTLFGPRMRRIVRLLQKIG